MPVFKIAESRANKDEGPKNIADVLDATRGPYLNSCFSSPDGVTGVNTGYDESQQTAAPAAVGFDIVVAARPSMGKTNIRDEPGRKRGDAAGTNRYLIFSLEMPSGRDHDAFSGLAVAR